MLWVGNLSTHVGEDDATAVFASQRALECIIMHTDSHSNAFILYSSLEALRGYKVKGSFIRVVIP
uniref:Uncharacterized protein n=1 Tax=Aegilops tauschii subsp. strangulata TaxID=200361 RepID=A0A452YSI1_AEGTS